MKTEKTAAAHHKIDPNAANNKFYKIETVRSLLFMSKLVLERWL